MVTQGFQSTDSLSNRDKPWFQPPLLFAVLRVELIEQIELDFT
jgi:hypothetical protein